MSADLSYDDVLAAAETLSVAERFQLAMELLNQCRGAVGTEELEVKPKKGKAKSKSAPKAKGPTKYNEYQKFIGGLIDGLKKEHKELKFNKTEAVKQFYNKGGEAETDEDVIREWALENAEEDTKSTSSKSSKGKSSKSSKGKKAEGDAESDAEPEADASDAEEKPKKKRTRSAESIAKQKATMAAKKAAAAAAAKAESDSDSESESEAESEDEKPAVRISAAAGGAGGKKSPKTELPW